MSGTHSRESSRDAYMDIGVRANQETEPNGDRDYVWTTAWTQEVENVWNTFSNAFISPFAESKFISFNY